MNGVLPDGKSSSSCPRVQVVAWCLGILCLILLSAVIALCVYSAHESDRLVSDLKQLKDNQTTLLAVNGILESRNTNLTTENLQLKTEKSNLERRIENMIRERNELNLTRAQWSLNTYCPLTKNTQERQCGLCQKGWIHSPSLSSCYAIVDPASPGRRTWEEARENCRGKNSHLVIIGSPEEQKFIYENSWGFTNETSGYWIGLTDAAGSWKWVDGSDLTEDYWIKQPAANAHCAISLKKPWMETPYGWNAVNSLRLPFQPSYRTVADLSDLCRMNRKAQEPAVIFKNPHVSLSAEKNEEEADYANTKGSIADQSPTISDESSPSHFQSSLLIAVCWVILVGIMAPRIYFTSVISEINAELRENQTENLQLKTEDNLTHAQWSLDAYCPKKGNKRQCKACQEQWIHFQSSCYAIANPDSSGRRTWEEAREDCRRINSDLVIIGSPEEQEFINDISFGITSETSGYWIGLTDAAGSWKWVDGSDVTEE
ncbi:uncharacterized protein [Centroberyx affinis]|uniref:uncharacterized protein n=1 Tax=Centroberyx affinis TaxID=166261 RepID=UPI003A5C2C6D